MSHMPSVSRREEGASAGVESQPIMSETARAKRRSVSSGSVNINRVDKRISSNGTLPETPSQSADSKRRSKKLFPSLGTNRAGTEVLNPANSSPSVKNTKMNLSSVQNSSKMTARSPRHLVSERKRKGMSFFQSKTTTYKEDKDDKNSSELSVTKTRSSTPPPLMSSPPKGKGISLMVKDKEEKKNLLQIYFDLYRSKEEELCSAPQSLRSPYHYLPLVRLQDILEHEELKKMNRKMIETEKNAKKGEDSDSDSDSDSEEKKQKKRKKKEKDRKPTMMAGTKPATPPLPPLPAPLPAPLPGALPPAIPPSIAPPPAVAPLPPPVKDLPPPDDKKDNTLKTINKPMKITSSEEDEGGEIIRSQSGTSFKIPRSSSTTTNSSPSFDDFKRGMRGSELGGEKRFSSLDGKWEKIDTSQISLFSPAITFSSSSTVKIACLPNKHDSSELNTEIQSIEQFRTLLAENAKKNRKTLQEIDFKVITFQQWFISMSEQKDKEFEKKQKEKELHLKQLRENEYSAKRKPVDRRGTAAQKQVATPVQYTQKASDPTEIERSYGGVRITVNPLRVFLRALEAHKENEANAAEQVQPLENELDEKYLLEQKKERDQLAALEKQRAQLGLGGDAQNNMVGRMEEQDQQPPNSPSEK